MLITVPLQLIWLNHKIRPTGSDRCFLLSSSETKKKEGCQEGWAINHWNESKMRCGSFGKAGKNCRKRSGKRLKLFQSEMLYLLSLSSPRCGWWCVLGLYPHPVTAGVDSSSLFLRYTNVTRQRGPLLMEKQHRGVIRLRLSQYFTLRFKYLPHADRHVLSFCSWGSSKTCLCVRPRSLWYGWEVPTTPKTVILDSWQKLVSIHTSQCGCMCVWLWDSRLWWVFALNRRA